MQPQAGPTPVRRRLSRSTFLCAALLLPMGTAVKVSVPDSLVTPEGEIDLGDGNVTRFSLAGGSGTHFQEVWLPLGYGDCGSTGVPLDFKDEFKEVGVAVDHQASQRIHVGVRGGYVWSDYSFASGYDTTLYDITDDRNFLHVDPYVSVEWKYVGIGVGGVFASKQIPDGSTEDYPLDESGDAQVSGHLRLGSLSSIYANASVWEGTPLLTSGHMMAGVGIRPARPLELYAGYVGEGPYMNDQWLGRITVDANPNWTFQLDMRFPGDWNGLGDEYGTSIGVTYRTRR